MVKSQIKNRFYRTVDLVGTLPEKAGFFYKKQSSLRGMK